MKNLFQAFAKYNIGVNQDIIKLLEPLNKEDMMKETKAYYPSIFETLLHVFMSDLVWLRRYRESLKGNKVLSNSSVLALEEKGLRKEFELDYRKFYQYRKQADEVIIQFVTGLDENQLNSTIKYKSYKGEDVEKELWKTFLHWFNHQTHHRGQVSVLLDLIGVDHDYSGLMSRI
jgi:uncharacterized damage-inducible protein DinB